MTANNNSPFGFRATRPLAGYAPTGASDVYQINNTNANKIFCGDPVLISGGYIDIAVSTTNPVLPIGIFAGCEYYDSVQKKPVWFPAWLAPTSSVSGKVTAWVVTDPKQVFEVQSTLANIPYTSVGKNANFVAGTGNSQSGQSTAALDTSVATTNTLPFRIVGLSTQITLGGDPTGSYNIVEVVLNDAFYNQLTGA